jgi:PAS domain S-box-containing protein
VLSRTRLYVTTLTAAAVGVVVLLLVAVPTPVPSPIVIILLIAATVLTERTDVAFRWDRTLGQFTLIEVAIAAGLLLVPTIDVLIAVAPAMVLAHITLLRTPVKVAYNVAVSTLGTAIAGLALVLAPDVGPMVAGRSVLGVMVGMLAYAGISAVAFAGLLARLQGPERAVTLRAQLPLHTATTLGTTSVGVVLAALWVLQPALVPFVLAPAAAVHIALRASVRATASLAAQQAEHDRLVRVVDGASDGILLLDADGIVQVWNPSMARLTGRPAQQTVGGPVARALPGSVRQGDRDVTGRWTLDDAHPNFPQREEDARLTDPDGVVRDVRESHAFTFDDRGRCTGAVVVVRDVSRQRELERLRSDFVARVSHELRTPLTPIRGFASVLLRRGDQLRPDQREEALTRIVERSDHLHGLVEDLLLVTRLEHDEVAELVHAQPTDLGQLARAAVDELSVRRSGRPVTCAVATDLPLALADADRTRQILAVLLDNADRYSPADTPIEVEVDHRGDDVRIRVVDHGGGIPARERDAVFERFHRLEDPLTMRTSGVGVGLFIGRRLAQAMHGTLEIQATPPGTGAALSLRLPVAVRARIDPHVTTAGRVEPGETAR